MAEKDIEAAQFPKTTVAAYFRLCAKNVALLRFHNKLTLF